MEAGSLLSSFHSLPLSSERFAFFFFLFLFFVSADHGRSTRERVVHLSPALGPRARRRPRGPPQSGRLRGRRAERHRAGGPRDAARAERRGDRGVRAAARRGRGQRGAQGGLRRRGDPRRERVPPGPVPADHRQRADGRVWRRGGEPRALCVGGHG